MKALLGLFLLAAFTASAHAQVQLNCRCACKNGTNQCLEILNKLDCKAKCEFSACGVGEVVSGTIGYGNCPLRRGTATSRAQLTNHVLWAIWHQGRVVFSGGPNDEIVKGEALRNPLLGGFPDNDRDQAQQDGYGAVKYATTADLDAAAATALARCRTEVPAVVNIHDHLDWVCNRQSAGGLLRSYAESGRWQDIRNKFSDLETQDPNIKNVLACFPGPELKNMVLTWCRPVGGTSEAGNRDAGDHGFPGRNFIQQAQRPRVWIPILLVVAVLVWLGLRGRGRVAS